MPQAPPFEGTPEQRQKLDDFGAERRFSESLLGSWQASTMAIGFFLGIND